MSDVPTQALWSWAELSVALTGKETVAGPDVAGVVADSRAVGPGDLFVALPGDPGPRFNPSVRSSVDGHDFVADAAAHGAAGALVHRVPAGAGDLPLLMVEDTYDGLWRLGHAARKRLQGNVCAITGSSGKTTAKQFISAALDAYAPPGSFNNHIGVPLSLANAAPQRDAVFEVGTNHPGEIEPLAQMVEPTFAVLLNVQQAHIENFPSWAHLREEKISIFNALRDKSKAISEDLVELGYGLTFGFSAAADARVVRVVGDRAEIDFRGQRFTARVPGGGRHRALTVAATLLACHVAGRDLQAACHLPAALVPKGRGNILEAAGVRILDDSYNANPDSMAAALDTLATEPGPKVAVLGEMLELGDAGPAAHAALAARLEGIDQVFCVGEGMRALVDKAPGCTWFEQADAALLAALGDVVAPGTSVLVKGSNRVFWARDFVPQLAAALAENN